MAEENLAVSPENTEEGPAHGPVETRVHPREIMGDALPKPITQAQRQQAVGASRPTAVGKPKQTPSIPVIPELIEETFSDRTLLMHILSGGSAVDTQQMLTAGRRRSGVGKANDMTVRMKTVAREALRTS